MGFQLAAAFTAFVIGPFGTSKVLGSRGIADTH